MWDWQKPGPPYEQLSQAIIRAILSSSEVQSFIEELHEQGGLEAEDIVALALRFPPEGGLEAKVELMRRGESEESEGSVDEEPGSVDQEEEFSQQGTELSRKIEGSPPSRSPNEIAFENFLQDQFDSEAWMREVGIRFLNEEEIPVEDSKTTPG